MRSFFLCSILAATAVVGTANAATVQVDWTGVVSSRSAAAEIGDTISGSFSYNNTTVSPPGFAGSYLTNHDSSFSMNGLSGSMSGNWINIYNDDADAGDQFSSGIYSGTYTGDLVNGYQVSQIFVRFNDSTDAVFSDRSLPSTLDSTDFDFGHRSRIDLANGGGAVAFYVSDFTATVVPLPAAVWLFGSALAGLGWMRRIKSV